jgi:hypothetical protein
MMIQSTVETAFRTQLLELALTATVPPVTPPGGTDDGVAVSVNVQV